MRKPPPNALNGVVAHTELTLTLILQQLPQEYHVHVSPCCAKLSLHRSWLPGEKLTTIKLPLLRIGDLKVV
jgi:hypothetical protein